MRNARVLLGVLLALSLMWVLTGCGSSSDDQGRIAFGTGVGASANIDIMNGTGTSQALVTTSGAQPSITRVGDLIAFVRGNNIFTTSPNGAVIRQVTTNTSADVVLSNPAISPGGSKVAYVVTSTTPGSTGAIHIVNVNGAGDTQLITNATQPAWSPDSSRMLFVRGSDVFVVNASTGQGATNITNNAVGVNVANPAFTPSGAQIAYGQTATTPGAVSEIHIRNVNGTGDTVFVTNASQPAFRPTGERMAFVRAGNIFTVNNQGTDLKQLTTIGTANTPSWSL